MVWGKSEFLPELRIRKHENWRMAWLKRFCFRFYNRIIYATVQWCAAFVLPHETAPSRAFPMFYSDTYQPDPGNPNVPQLSSAPLSENSFCPQSGAILTGLWCPKCTVKIRK